MPLFALTCLDRPGAQDLRAATRAAHLAYVEQTGAVQLGGPLMDDLGGMIGSLIIIEAPDRAGAEAWAAGDPYALAGLFDSVTIRAWRRVIG